MTVIELIQELEKFREQHGDVEVYTSIDDEGNGYNKVIYEPMEMYRSIDDTVNHPDLVNPEDIGDLTGQDSEDESEIDMSDFVKVCVL